jgi:hypothetical protein
MVTTAAPLVDAVLYWNELFAQWIAPAGRLAGPFLIVFLALFIVASVGTRLVPAATRIWPVLPTCLFVGGLLLLLLASALPTLVMPLRRWQIGWGNWAFVASVAITGVVVLALGMATRLRIRVDVRDKSGQPDLSAADYVLARLERLGSDRPRGLQRPQQTDVMGLPENAVDTLPEGKVLSALFKLVYAIIPLMPWRATASWLDSDRLSITLARNGRLVNATVVSRLALGLPGAKSDDEQSADPLRAKLLTGAAAFVLLELSQKAPALRNGLSGASRWDSLTLQVLATDPKPEPEPESDLRLLAQAVDRDPANSMAKFAFLTHRCRYSADADEQRRFANAMSGLVLRLAPSGTVQTGSEALEMRALFAEGAAWLNAHLLRDDGDALSKAAGATRMLLKRCDEHASGKIQGFVAEVGPSAGLLWRCVVAADRAVFDKDVDKIATRWAEKQELSLLAHYDRACERMAIEPADVAGALEDVHLAMALEPMRAWALQDPSLKELRKRDEFWATAGQPRVTGFTDLQSVKPHATKLEAAGIHTARQLGQRTASREDKVEFSVYLGVSFQEIVRLHRLARMACSTTYLIEQPWLVDLLITVGVDSCQELQHRLNTDETRLRRALRDAADRRGITTELPASEEMTPTT